MCKTRFGSQGDSRWVLSKKIEEKKTLVELETPLTPLMENSIKISILFLEYFPIDKQQTGAFSENYESNCLYDTSSISRYQNAPSHANFLYSRLILC